MSRQHSTNTSSSQTALAGSTNQSQQLSIANVLTPAAAATQIAKSKIDFVQLDALVLLKILKHCQETGSGAESAQGILTGMIQSHEGNSNRIEITNCFGLPNPNNLKEQGDYNDSILNIFFFLEIR